ncbi:hypothetical protein MTO96_024392 [Rhipicephalus appendiculatus]
MKRVFVKHIPKSQPHKRPLVQKVILKRGLRCYTLEHKKKHRRKSLPHHTPRSGTSNNVKRLRASKGDEHSHEDHWVTGVQGLFQVGPFGNERFKSTDRSERRRFDTRSVRAGTSAWERCRVRQHTWASSSDVARSPHRSPGCSANENPSLRIATPGAERQR